MTSLSLVGRRALPVFPVLFALVVAQGLAALDVPPLERAPNDESEYRRFVLENGMKVILLSDPKLNKSAGAVSVEVGSLSDPMERQGLAHFLEHMLFLGTEKYPDEAEYGNYLRSNGGYSNAYTAGDHSNYHFEIRHEAFEGAIDRFSQFFIAPLFTPEFTEREINAVHSEHQQNLENDNWRGLQLRRSLYRSDHPENRFSTGDRDTLGGTAREELLSFHDRHYSANRMTLALSGRAGLDQLEAWAREYFAAVENRGLPRISYPPEYLSPKAALRIARMEPIRDLRQLNMEFPLPSLSDRWGGKSAELLGHILGYEGEGSLLSALKAEGLATTLGAGAYENTRDYASFSISIGLTPAGLENYSRVLGLVFSAIAELRRAGYPAHLFEEQKTLARLNERYVDKGEGAPRTSALANQARVYPLEVAERASFLWLEPDPEGYNLILERIKPDNMLVTLVAQGVETDATEPRYGTRFSYREETGDAYATLLSPPAIAGFHLPKPNPFMPQRASLLALQPVRLIDEPGLSLYYLQDAEFARPMAAQVHRFRLPRSMGTLEDAVLLAFYEACVNEALNEISYTAATAGLHVSVSAALEGIQVAIDGYDESADRLAEVVVANLLDFELPEERFAALKDQLVRGLRNFPRSDAWRYLLEVRRAVVREFHFRPEEQLALAEQVTLGAVKDFARRAFQRGKLESLVHGNVTAAQAIASTRRLAQALRAQPIAESEVLRRRLVTQSPGEALVGVEQLIVNNSAFRQEYLLGDDAPEIRAATLVLSNFISEPFFSEMRTRQQLGYVVFGGAGDEERTNFAFFIIQSPEHAADEVQARAEAFIAQLPGMLAELPDDAWEMLVAGCRAQLEEKDKTIAERAGRLFNLAYNYDGDWGRRSDTLAALDTLTRERAVEILSTALSPETGRKRTFLGFARQHARPESLAGDFADREKWKAGRTYQ